MGLPKTKVSLIDSLPRIKGKYREQADIARNTWFQVGGPAEVLMKPDDVEDIAALMRAVGEKVPVTVIGVGSNLLVRDGGVEGVVIRLGRNFTQVARCQMPDASNEKNWPLATGYWYLKIGAGCLNSNAAQYCIENGIAGLEFLSGVPGTIGGALAMNAGAYGAEVKDVLDSATLVDAKGNIKTVAVDELGYEYRHRRNYEGAVFVEGVFKAKKSDSETVRKAMQEIQERREATQPIRNKTGGSTFKNPEGHKAWELIDKAGCRGLKLGGAMVSEKHCNFLINTGDATAADIENLGELVRKKVFESSGIMLEWEIQRIGVR